VLVEEKGTTSLQRKKTPPEHVDRGILAAGNFDPRDVAVRIAEETED
jgi:hypothetical protein